MRASPRPFRLLALAGLLAGGLPAADYIPAGEDGGFIRLTDAECGTADRFAVQLAPVDAPPGFAALQPQTVIQRRESGGWILFAGGWPENLDGRFDLLVRCGEAPEAPVVRLPAAIHRQTRRMDVALLLDDSHSMRTTDPLRLRVAAARLFAQLAAARGDIQTITLVAFNRRARLLLGPTHPGETATIDAALNNLEASGATDLDSAFALAGDVFDGLPPSRKIAVVLSDGRDEPGNYTFGHRHFSARHWPVHTIGMSDEIDAQTLQLIAASTGGNYHRARNTESLAHIFRDIATSLQPSVSLGEWSLAPDESGTFPVDDTVRILSLALIDRLETASACSLRAPDAVLRALATDRPAEAFADIYAPATGSWSLQGTRAEALIAVSASSSLDIIPFPLVAEPTPGTPFPVAAFVLQSDRIVPSATIHARVPQGPDCLLKDDGMNADGLAGDGVYGGYLNVEQPGDLRLAFQATGTTPAGLAFQRLAYRSCVVRKAESVDPSAHRNAIPRAKWHFDGDALSTWPTLAQPRFLPSAPGLAEIRSSKGLVSLDAWAALEPALQPATLFTPDAAASPESLIPADTTLLASEDTAPPSWLSQFNLWSILLLLLAIVFLLWLISRWFARPNLRTSRMAPFFAVSLLLHALLAVLFMNLLIQTRVITVEQISPSLAVTLQAVEQSLGVSLTPPGPAVPLRDSAPTTELAKPSPAMPETSDVKSSPLSARLVPESSPAQTPSPTAAAAKALETPALASGADTPDSKSELPAAPQAVAESLALTPTPPAPATPAADSGAAAQPVALAKAQTTRASPSDAAPPQFTAKASASSSPARAPTPAIAAAAKALETPALAPNADRPDVKSAMPAPPQATAETMTLVPTPPAPTATATDAGSAAQPVALAKAQTTRANPSDSVPPQFTAKASPSASPAQAPAPAVAATAKALETPALAPGADNPAVKSDLPAPPQAAAETLALVPTQPAPTTTATDAGSAAQPVALAKAQTTRASPSDAAPPQFTAKAAPSSTPAQASAPTVIAAIKGLDSPALAPGAESPDVKSDLPAPPQAAAETLALAPTPKAPAATATDSGSVAQTVAIAKQATPVPTDMAFYQPSQRVLTEPTAPLPTATLSTADAKESAKLTSPMLHDVEAAPLAFTIGKGGVDSRTVTIGLAQYGGDWDWARHAMTFLGHQLRERTRLAINASDRVVTFSSPDLAKLPFVYMTGHKDFRLTETEVANLRAYLLGGGYLWADDSTHYQDETFDQAFRRELARILPDAPLERLGMDFAGFKTGYDLSQGYKGYAIPPGDKYRLDYIEGVTLGNRVSVVYTRNDYGDGLNIDAHTHPLHVSLTDLSPAEMQEGAVRMGMNLTLYFLTHGKGDAAFMDHTSTTLRQQREATVTAVPGGTARPLAAFAPTASWEHEAWSDAGIISQKDQVFDIAYTVGENQKCAFSQLQDPPCTVTAQDVIAFQVTSELRGGARLALAFTIDGCYFEARPVYVKPGVNLVTFPCGESTFKTETGGWLYRDLLPATAAIQRLTLLIYSPSAGKMHISQGRIIRRGP